MPPKRSARIAGKPTQSTLAFHGVSNKVVKSSARVPTAKDLIAESTSKAPEADAPNVAAVPSVIEPVDEVTLAEPEATTKDSDIIKQTEQETAAQQVSTSPEDVEARGLSNAQIQNYWQAKEKERKVPRVHQQDLSLHERILREFDISSQYGVRMPDFIQCG